MIFLRIFWQSLILPNKRALFKLNRIGMDFVVIYMFLLLLFVSIPSLIDQAVASQEVNVQLFFLIIYFFIFYYLPMNVIVFLFLSIIAFLSMGITKIMQRKLRFAILWKMSAFATTLPFTVYTIISLFVSIHNVYLWFSILYTFVLILKMISIYPKRSTRLNREK